MLIKESQVSLQPGIVEVDLAVEIDSRIILTFPLNFDSQRIETQPDPHMLPGVVFHCGPELEDRSLKIVILQVKRLGTGTDEPAGRQGDVHAQTQNGQRCCKPCGALFIDRTGHRQPHIDGHDVGTDLDGQIQAIALEERIAVGKLVDVQIEEGVNVGAGINGYFIAVLILDDDVLQDLAAAVPST